MMNNQMANITDSVVIQSDIEARVALDLAKIIAKQEDSEAQYTREYWLTLYYQCRKATATSSIYYDLDDILKDISQT